MYLPARVWSQQNQDSKFRTGVLHILAGHSGPETAADARTHFGIFAPQVWKLFPRGQIINVSFWDYNDVAAGYFAAAEIAAREKKVGIIAIEVARLRDFAPGKPKHGYVVAQGSSATFNLVQMLPKLEDAGINVKVISAISEELFDHQPESYRNSVLPPEAVYDLMFISSGTRRMWPLRNVGPLTDEYSMTSDFHNQWLTGGLEPDVIAEAHLDQKSIVEGVTRFANDRGKRLDATKGLLGKL
jgi:transketolase